MQRSVVFDQYVLSAQPFARPVLLYVHDLVLAACPEVTIEQKWQFPCFIYKKKILCSIAAFKEHCAMGFWLGAKMNDPHGILKTDADRNSMGNLGKIKSISDLPNEEILLDFIQQGIELIDAGVTPDKKKVDTPLEIPAELTEALQYSPEARKHFNAFSIAKKREYANWIAEAKTETTRDKRVLQAIAWLEEGKSRNWKYGM